MYYFDRFSHLMDNAVRRYMPGEATPLEVMQVDVLDGQHGGYDIYETSLDKGGQLYAVAGVIVESELAQERFEAVVGRRNVVDFGDIKGFRYGVVGNMLGILQQPKSCYYYNSDAWVLQGQSVLQVIGIDLSQYFEGMSELIGHTIRELSLPSS